MAKVTIDEKMNMVNELVRESRCQVGAAVFAVGGFQLRNALIGGSSRVSRSKYSRDYIPFFRSSALRLLAFLFLFGLGFVADHRPHTHLLPLFTMRVPAHLSEIPWPEQIPSTRQATQSWCTNFTYRL